MSDTATPWPGSPEFYREKALALLKEAETATDEGRRASLLNLAEHWRRLAQNAEQPSW